LPDYLYECPCGKFFEATRSMTEELGTYPCACGKTASRRYTVPAMHLFGGLGDRFRYPETEAERDRIVYAAKKTEEYARTHDMSDYVWEPGKGAPEWSQPNVLEIEKSAQTSTS